MRAGAYVVKLRAEVLTSRATLLEKEFRLLVGSENADLYFREALLAEYAGSNVGRSSNTLPSRTSISGTIGRPAAAGTSR